MDQSIISIDEYQGKGSECGSDARHRILLQHGTVPPTQDPYCILTLGKEQKKTKVKNEAGKRPVWN